MSDEYDENDEISSDDDVDNGELSSGDKDDEKSEGGEVTYKHAQQTASGFDDSYEKFDPISKAINEFNDAMGELSCGRLVNLESLKKHLKDNIPRLATLNMRLLALAVCYFAEYKSITNDSVTKFIKRRGKGIEPIDMIRYIKFYNNNKMTA